MARGDFNYSSRPCLVLYKKQVTLCAPNPGPMMVGPFSIQMQMGTHSAALIKSKVTRSATDLDLFSRHPILTLCPLQILMRAHTSLDEARWGVHA